MILCSIFTKFWLPSIICIIAICAYALVIFRLNNDRFFKFILWFTLAIAVSYFLCDLYVMAAISKAVECFYDWLPLILLAILHSCEIFLLQTHFFDNGYEDFFFLHDDQFSQRIMNPVENETVLLIVMVTLVVLASITSISLIIRVFAKRREDRNWLALHSANSGNTHIFLQDNECSSALAKDIKSSLESSLTVLVAYPNPNADSLGLSLWEKITRFLHPSANGNESFDTIVYTKSPLSEITENNFYDGLGLKELQPYFNDERCKLYLLGDDEEENFRIVYLLNNVGCKAEIFCRACREGANRMYEEALTNSEKRNFHIVDSSYLAVRAVKANHELLPVNFVKKGTDKSGRQAGWVASEFHSLIIGFGEIGRESLKFLYEHAAFIGKDYKKSPFRCTIIDSYADGLEMELNHSFPGMTEENGVHLKKMDAGSKSFWDMLKSDIARLNYIVICTGDDKLNLRLATDILEFGNKSGRKLSENLAILVSIKNPGNLDDAVVRHYNSIKEYGGCLHVFADERSLWTYDNITNNSLDERAKKYFISYNRAQGITAEESIIAWDKREAKIRQSDDYKLFLDSLRKKQQDYANCFHIPTKLALMGDEIVEHRLEISSEIPESYTGTHYTGKDEHVKKLLKYLSVGEHIRWEASHVALGYKPGEERDVLLKVHEYIKDYDELDPVIQHYDYLVVKTTLELCHN